MWDIQQFMSLGFINRYIAKQRWGRLWPYTYLFILFGLGRKWTPIPCQGLTFKAMNCRLSKYDPVLVHVAFCCLPGISPLNVLFLVKQSRKKFFSGQPLWDSRYTCRRSRDFITELVASLPACQVLGWLTVKQVQVWLDLLWTGWPGTSKIAPLSLEGKG